MNKDISKTILLVEDEALIAMLEKKQLEEKGYNIHHVFTAEKAIEICNKNERPVDLILMDIDLGSGIDGTQAAEEILKENDIPVVFLSSHTEPEIVEKTEKITSYGYVVKNSGIVVLDASIKMALKLFEAKTEQKKIEKKIKSSDERFQKMLGMVPDMISTHDPEMNILYSNWNGFASIEQDRRVLGTKCYNTYRGYDDICPDCRAKEVLVSKKPIQEVIQLTDGDWFEIRVIPILDDTNNIEFFVEWVRDITKQKQTEIDLRNNEEKFRSYVENANDVIYTISHEGRITYVSPNWMDYMGESAENAIGKSFEPYVHPEDVHLCKKFLKKVLTTNSKQSEVEYRVRRADGVWRWHISNGSPLYNNEGKVVGYLGIARDITARKEFENKLQKEINEKEILLREINHRVKNNILSIESFMLLQANSQSNVEVKNELQKAVFRIQAFRKVYENLSISNDHTDISVKKYLDHIIISIIDAYGLDRNIVLKYDICDLSVNSKTAAYLGIITNELLINVFKHSFKEKKVTAFILLAKTKNEVSLTVQDNGIGMEENFDFCKSSGFGLSIVKMLVDHLEGKVNYTVKNGVTCEIKIPL